MGCIITMMSQNAAKAFIHPLLNLAVDDDHFDYCFQWVLLAISFSLSLQLCQSSVIGMSVLD